MTEKNDEIDEEPRDHTAQDAKAGGTLAVLAALGTLSALWALFLWTELVAARGGAEPFCGFSDGASCGELWDAAFASNIHHLTGLPVAGWGLVWGLAAFVLPLLALRRFADGGEPQKLLAAVQWTAAGGFAGVGAMLAASAAAGLFCKSCGVTYVVVLAYGVVTFYKLDLKPLLPASGMGRAVAAVAAAYVLLLYPGVRTPRNTADAGDKALRAATQGQAEARKEKETAPAPPPSTEAPSTEAPATDTASTETAPPPPSSTPPVKTSAEAETLLGDFLESISNQPQVLQALSNFLGFYRDSKKTYEEEPRNLHGSPTAPVRITEFTDALCGHCASLHGTLSYLESVLPTGSFSVDSRHFPLDGNCNARLVARGPESVRCLAAKAQICMEQTAHSFEFAGAIFEKQQVLTNDLVYELAAPYMDRKTLQACVGDASTAARLAEDVEYAWQFEPDGTPLVLVNGKQGTAFGPFLYVMALTGGHTDHPLLADLPPPQAMDHVH